MTHHSHSHSMKLLITPEKYAHASLLSKKKSLQTFLNPETPRSPKKTEFKSIITKSKPKKPLIQISTVQKVSKLQDLNEGPSPSIKCRGFAQYGLPPGTLFQKKSQTASAKGVPINVERATSFKATFEEVYGRNSSPLTIRAVSSVSHQRLQSLRGQDMTSTKHEINLPKIDSIRESENLTPIDAPPFAIKVSLAEKFTEKLQLTFRQRQLESTRDAVQPWKPMIPFTDRPTSQIGLPIVNFEQSFGKTNHLSILEKVGVPSIQNQVWEKYEHKPFSGLTSLTHRFRPISRATSSNNSQVNSPTQILNKGKTFKFESKVIQSETKRKSDVHVKSIRTSMLSLNDNKPENINLNMKDEKILVADCNLSGIQPERLNTSREELVEIIDKIEFQ